ncbi:MAG: DUF4302 domain-containing protein [Dysgonomonas sp.]
MKKALYILFLIPFLFAQSCVDEEKDLFDESASNRMKERLNKFEEILTSAPNGWIMQYYAGEESKLLGGFNFLCKFEKGEVTMASEVLYASANDTVKPGTQVKSSYSLVANRGPVLSFDSYNKIFHYFSEPSGGNIEGYKGDYEFVFMDETPNPDRIELKGSKYKNKIVLTRLPENVVWQDYIDGIVELKEKLDLNYVYNVQIDGAAAPDWFLFDAQERRFDLCVEKVNTSIPVQVQNSVYTSTGVKFYQPIEYGGLTLDSLIWNDDANCFTGSDGSKTIKLTPTIPEGITLYDDYLGDYSLNYLNLDDRPQNINVSFVRNVNNRSMILKGVPVTDLALTYSRLTGNVLLKQQEIVYSTEYGGWLYLFFIGSDGGSIPSISIDEGAFTGTFEADGKTIIMENDMSVPTGRWLTLILFKDDQLYLMSENASYSNMVFTKK